jgi:hypothetical protein
VVVGFSPVASDAVASASIARCDIGFHADDRLEPSFLGFFLELPSAVKVTVISYRECWLLELQRLGDEIIDTVCAVEKRVFGVAVKVNEGHGVR